MLELYRRAIMAGNAALKYGSELPESAKTDKS
jgi:hypothetical protein